MLFSFVLVYISEDWHFSVQPIDIWYNLICSLCRIQLTDSHIIHLIILDRTAYFVSSEISSFFWDEDILTSMVTLLLKYKRILQGVIIPLSEIRESVLESSDGQLVTVCLKHLPQLYSWLSGWRSVNALASHRCNPGSKPGVSMWDGHVVTKSDRWVSSGHSGFLPHEHHPNANIGASEHD